MTTWRMYIEFSATDAQRTQVSDEVAALVAAIDPRAGHMSFALAKEE